MVEAERKEFGEAIGAMCAVFGTDASRALLYGYWMALSDLSLPDLRHAVARSMRECHHLPRAVELRRLAGERTAEAGAIVAWDDVQHAIPLGPYKHVDFDDKIINATIRNLGGWPTFIGRLTDPESEKWLRIEFIKCYQHISATGFSKDAYQALPGLSQAQAIDGQVNTPKPVRIPMAILGRTRTHIDVTCSSPRIAQTEISRNQPGLTP